MEICGGKEPLPVTESTACKSVNRREASALEELAQKGTGTLVCQSV